MLYVFKRGFQQLLEGQPCCNWLEFDDGFYYDLKLLVLHVIVLNILEIS